MSGFVTGKRAITDKEKKNILDRIFEVWKKNPELRLMQLIDNPLSELEMTFYLEDTELADAIEEFYGEEH